MLKAWIIFGLVVVGVSMAWLARGLSREDYCALACTDARACSIAIPEQCEEHCERGHRSIVLPRTCDELRTNIDKSGYLW